jgi:hypothetical protein
MKIGLLFAVLAIGLRPALVVAETPCTNVYIYNGTIGGVLPHATPADLFAKNSIEELLKTANGLCLKGYVESGPEWQLQNHQKTDILLSYTLGTLDDSNGVGDVGKTIEVITFDVYSWDGKLNHIVNTGPDIAWFAVSRDTLRLQNWARGAVGMLEAIDKSKSILDARWHIVHDPDKPSIGPIPARGLVSKLRSVAARVLHILGTV